MCLFVTTGERVRLVVATREQMCPVVVEVSEKGIFEEFGRSHSNDTG